MDSLAKSVLSDLGLKMGQSVLAPTQSQRRPPAWTEAEVIGVGNPLELAPGQQVKLLVQDSGGFSTTVTEWFPLYAKRQSHILEEESDRFDRRILSESMPEFLAQRESKQYAAGSRRGDGKS